MKTILVTGGAGFIGSTFVRRILSHTEARIINLDSLTYAGNLDSLAAVQDCARHVFVCGDIGNMRLVRTLLEQYQCEAMVNFAAESHVDRSIGCPPEFVRTNVLGTFNLLEAALAYWESLEGQASERFRFLHVSTDEVFGTLTAAGKFTESTPYAPNSPSSASKAAGDHFVRAYQRTYGLPTVITYSSNNYGPYQHPEKFIPLTILSALEQRSLPVYGTGQNIRDWLFVDDHCDALELALERACPGETYNIGGNCELTNLEVAEAVCDVIDRLRARPSQRSSRELIEFVADRPGHDYRYAIDTTKIQGDLQWQPATDFASGIETTAQWYMENTMWVQRACAGRTRHTPARGRQVTLPVSLGKPGHGAAELPAVERPGR